MSALRCAGRSCVQDAYKSQVKKRLLQDLHAFAVCLRSILSFESAFCSGSKNLQNDFFNCLKQLKIKLGHQLVKKNPKPNILASNLCKAFKGFMSIVDLFLPLIFIYILVYLQEQISKNTGNKMSFKIYIILYCFLRTFNNFQLLSPKIELKWKDVLDFGELLPQHLP